MTPLLEPFFNQSMDCLCIADYNGYFVNINPAFISLLGYTEEELNSKLISDFIYHEDKERTASYRKRLMSNVPLVNFENRYVSKSGSIVWFHWTAIPLENEQLIYAIAKDITHTKELEKERISHLNQLSKVNKKLKQQNYSTSHDLRSPLNNLISLVSLIDMTKIHDADTSEILSLIKLSAEGLKNTMNSYIDSFKEEDVHDTALEEVDLKIVFDKVKSSIGALIQRAGTEINVDFSTMETIHFKSIYMESIFLNLITNSIKYAKPSVPPLIKITSSQENGEKKLTYTDNGRGFDMNKMDGRIFKLNQEFQGKEDSAGVGLYLVHEQVTSLGGRITLDSEINQGSTFTILFKP
ncbi:sensor histidine kinase [Allomuricauda sp. F6463D]|uniref:sensor histidine kinase n=1 Tax=Allomuricauda sp. F6463D TaxID=2926409 RepID=UPI001FF369AE|nr:PAS domain-containing sensor histidine kinase [Muricauda sp. F6463D]MCK0159183.1 PAS domain-containing sensor histidine kinase [Muricauda sp. F6463D]